MRRESDRMLPFVFGAFFSIEDVPCLSAWLFLCVFPWGVSAVVLFFFFEAVGLSSTWKNRAFGISSPR